MNKKLLYVLIFLSILAIVGFYFQKNNNFNINDFSNMTLEDIEEAGGELTEEQADQLEAEMGTVPEETVTEDQ